MYCGMIGINDSSRFVVYVGSPPKVYMLDKKKIKKKIVFLLNLKTNAFLKLRRHEKATTKNNNKKKYTN